MIFRTNIPAPEFPFEINYDSKIMLLGSCFSDNIGGFFYRHRFQVCSNPFGVLFNPVSIDHACGCSSAPSRSTRTAIF